MPLKPLAPQIIICLSVVAVLVGIILSGAGRRVYLAYLSLAGLIGATFASFSLWGENVSLFSNLIKVDNLSNYANLLFLLATVMIVLGSLRAFSSRSYQGEYYVLILFSLVGAMIMTSATNLITLYLGLELTALPCYVLVALKKDKPGPSQAAVKYFLLGVFASAFMVYGMSFFYGLSGGVYFTDITAYLAEGLFSRPLVLLSLVLMMVGFGFKIAVFPFHFWAPDAYEGAFPQVGAFLSVVPKLAGVVAILRFFPGALSAVGSVWTVLFAGLAFLSMTYGNVVALSQKNIKRMLAYSGIAHMGYILVGLAAGTILAFRGMLLYFLVYGIANVGAFLVVAACSVAGKGEAIEDYAGLSKKNPFLAFSMALFLLSLVGIPPLAGFMGKFYLFGAAVSAGVVWLAVAGLINSVISLGYYSLVIKQMYLVESGGSESISVSAGLRVAITLLLLGLFLVGVFPSPVLSLLAQVF